MPFTITNTTKQKLPHHPFQKMAEKVLGSDYDLSLTVIDAAKIKEINQSHRGKNEATDILSFPLSENAGEIFLCLSEAKKQASDFDRTYDNFVAFLVIHGLMHLKGFDHSSTMEDNEKKIRQEFNI